MKKNQNNIFPAVNVPYSGLTLSCEINGETAVKTEMSDAANKNLKNRFNKIFEVKNLSVRMDKYEFPTKVDEQGQKDGENYFSIIHVDSNNMGAEI